MRGSHWDHPYRVCAGLPCPQSGRRPVGKRHCPSSSRRTAEDPASRAAPTPLDRSASSPPCQAADGAAQNLRWRTDRGRSRRSHRVGLTARRPVRNPSGCRGRYPLCIPHTTVIPGEGRRHEPIYASYSWLGVPPVGVEPTLGTLLGGRPLPLGYGGGFIIPPVQLPERGVTPDRDIIFADLDVVFG